MHDFSFKRGKLYCENVSVASLVKQHGSPLFVYSHATLTRNFQQLDEALAPLDHTVCFAAKANSNLGVLRTLAKAGSGFDLVSGGELQRIIAAGGDPAKCIFAGVGKTEEEIELALKKGIYAFNAESEPELIRINKVARRLKKKAPIAVRVNPNVDAKTHAKITTGTYENKFGIAFEEVEAIYERASKLKNLHISGVQMHIGSQLTEVGPFEKAVKKVYELKRRSKSKALIILIAEYANLYRLIDQISPDAYEHIHSKKPTTVIFDNVKNISKHAFGFDSIWTRMLSPSKA